MNIPTKYRDLATRALWTALQAVLAVVTVETLDLPATWILILTPAFSVLKSYVATKVGDPNTVTFKES